MFTVRVPATSANLGPGFDTLGLALDLYLTVEVKKANCDITVYYKENGEQSVNINPTDNLIIMAIEKVFTKAGQTISPLTLMVDNKIPISRGLGSSAAAIVAGIFAGNELIGRKYSTKQLMQWAVDLEGHADNIVPAIVGGFTTAMIYENEIYYQKLLTSHDFKAIVVVPDISLPTKQSRAVLPEKVALQDTVYNLQRACFLLASLYNGDIRHLNLAMDDMIYQPLRKQFIPGFDEVFKSAYDNGALGVAMSGAGPSIIAFVNDNIENIGLAMQEAFLNNSLTSKIYHLRPNETGVSIY
ncbi:MAG: homoserine kinase [Syntrophomonadaceae bacterium]|mgnify:CR=1 FL=1|nr:homoserine kinase [Syntrophomonadaceae bacterium]